MTWKSKREKELERLVEIQQQHIEYLQKPKNLSGYYTIVPVPQPEDMRTYYEKTAAFVTDQFYLFYITQLRRSIVDDFEAGKESPDVYRGKLALLGDIIRDACKARDIIKSNSIDSQAENAL